MATANSTAGPWLCSAGRKVAASTTKQQQQKQKSSTSCLSWPLLLSATFLQVLLDTILQLDVVTAFRHDLQPYLEDVDSAEAIPLFEAERAAFEPSHQQAGSKAAESLPGHYVSHLLSQVQPSTVQQVLDWQARDWLEYVRDAAGKLALLLQLTTGASSGYVGTQDDQQAPPHLLMAAQQLSQVLTATRTWCL